MVWPIFIGTVIPILFLVLIINGEHRNLLLFFVWGIVAFLLAYQFNTALNNLLNLSEISLETSAAPIVEELLKALPLLLFFFIKSKKPHPIVIYAMMSGIGFSIQENYLYLFEANLVGASAIAAMIVRSITTCLMHGMSTAVVGYGIDFLRKNKSGMITFTFSMFTIAVIMHSIFNLFIQSRFYIIGVLMPIVLYLLAIAVKYSSKDGKGFTLKL